INWQYMLTVNFSNMDSHLGQLLELRVENNNTNEEVGRVKVSAIPSSNFQVQIAGLQIGPEYKIQFYADFNNNGLYDAPPIDHAWEINFTNNTGDVNVNFSHNASFVDINWKYLLTVNLTSMTPHLGQKFELRVVRQDDQLEIGRFTLPQILVQNFSVFIPEFELGKNYNIDFYADHNGNGVYDAPPIDHAWRLSFISTTGDFIQNFTHNTNFTDIQWPGTTDISEIDGPIPARFALEQNYPNPFNPSTTINFSIPQKDFVTLKIYNLVGDEIQLLINEEKEAGIYNVTFEAINLPSGVYFYKIRAGNFTATKKMILMR
ncbi:MAG: T9SS type A sorting domain-containing protein, partial [Ignavibacterium sp.]